MTQTTRELKAELEKTLGLVRTLHDEVRMKAHLAGMDIRREWEELKPEVERLERTAGELTEAVRDTAADVVKRLSRLRATLEPKG